MTPQQLLDSVRYICKTDTSDNVGGDTDLLRILNERYQEICTTLISCNDNLYGVKATTNLNVNPNQEAYALPSNLVRLKRVEIAYDGATWRNVEMMDDEEILTFALDATTINQRFTQSDPKAVLYGSLLYLRPIPSIAVTNSLRLWYTALPGLLSNMTSSINVPAEYHPLLQYGVASDVALRQGEMDMYVACLKRWTDGLAGIKKSFPPRSFGTPLDLKERPTSYC